MKRITGYILAILLLTAFGAAPARASLIFSAEGTSAKGVDVSFEAELSIVNDELTVILRNTSDAASLNPDDLLASFYFDIVQGTDTRPTLGLVTAVGDVYLGLKDNTDQLQGADADLIATTTPKDGRWQFKTMDATQDPSLGFGIGTVGNNTLSPNNFNGNIVSPINYAIYADEITTQNLDGRLLVKETATFTFDGLDGFTEDDIVRRVAFGLGTAPDSTIDAVPIPGAVWLLGSGLVGLVFLRRKSLGSKLKAES